MNAARAFLVALCLLALLFPQLTTADDSREVVNATLRVLEPFVNTQWAGKVKAFNEDRYLDVVRQFKVVWGGSAVRITGYCTELGNEREGYIYWDAGANEIAVFLINNKGIFQRGTIDVTDNTNDNQRTDHIFGQGYRVQKHV